METAAAPPIMDSPSPILDIITSLQQLFVSFLLLCNALVRALIAFTKFLLISIKHVSPYTRPLFQWISAFSLCLWNYINSLSFAGKVFVASSSILTFIFTVCWRRGVFRRLGKYCRRLYRHARKSFHAHWTQFQEWITYVFRVTTEIITIMMPALTVVLPLRLYLARSVFRRLFSLATFLTSLCFSIKSLMDFYRNGPIVNQNESINNHNNDESISQQHVPASKRRRSLLDMRQEPSTERPKRKTVGEFGKKKPSAGIFGGAGSLFSSQHDNDDDQDESNDITPMLHDRSGGHRDHYSMLDDSNVMDVTVWLDYWVVASVFDFLMTVPITMSRLFFRSSSSSGSSLISYVMFGHIQESFPSSSSPFSPPLLTTSSSPYFNLNPFSPQSVAPSSSPSTWTAFAADGYSGALTITYDLTYSILLMFVISHKHRYLVLARRTLVGILDTFIYTLTGLQLVPTIAHSSDGFSPRTPQTPRGLVPQIWVFLKFYLPPTILLLFDLLAHVPQVFLLMLPTFLLRPALFIVSVVYPLIGSLRSLENGVYARQGYWLNYYTLYSIYETLLMRWLRSTPMWSWLPFRLHLELLFITIIQLLCLSPQLVTRMFLHRVLSPLQSMSTSSGIPQQQQKVLPTSSSASSPIIKEEIVSDDDYTPNHQRPLKMPISSTAHSSALSDPVVPKHRFRRLTSSGDDVIDSSSSNPSSGTSGGFINGINRTRKGNEADDVIRNRTISRQSSKGSSSSSHHHPPTETVAPRKSTFVPAAALHQDSSQVADERSESRPRRTVRDRAPSPSPPLQPSSGVVRSSRSTNRSSSTSKRTSSSSGTKRHPSRKATRDR